MSYPLAPAVPLPRQLAPTVGPSVALAGVSVRMGSLPSGERVVCGLAQQFGNLYFVEDNAGCFRGLPLLVNGTVILFGAHQVFVGTELPRAFPEHARVAADPPAHRAVRGPRIARPAGSVEVMVVAPPLAPAPLLPPKMLPLSLR